MKNGFTLVETVVTVVIILIFATFGLLGYRQVLDNARQRVCTTNLEALGAAVEIYALENDVLPASLSNLKPEHLKKGYAKAIGQRSWSTKFAYFFLKLNSSPEAYAQFLTPGNLEKYGMDPQIFHCPADTNGRPSYGINASIAGMRWKELPENTVLIAEVDSYVFTSLNQLAHRHIRKLGLDHIGLWITKKGDLNIQEGSPPSGPGQTEAECKQKCVDTYQSGKKGCKDTCDACITGCVGDIVCKNQCQATNVICKKTCRDIKDACFEGCKL